MSTYDQLVQRNAGYVPGDVQQRLRSASVLIAGCGIGSAIAESLVRVGCERLTLVDGDDVALHNLNRQDFVARDVGRRKVEALADRLRAINPEARIAVRDAWIGTTNAPALAAEADLVVDTIDFLDLAGIVALHDAARAAGKPVISAVSVGFGAAAVYFPPGSPCTFRQLFGLPADGPVGGYSYAERFAVVIERLAEKLDPDVVRAMAKALTIMEDGRPCPAPHVSVGAASVAALATTIALRVLGGRPVTAAPEMILVDMASAAALPGIDIAPR
jgi:molybdopterin/thiamine biosynthesis adenylyltransferase